MTLSPVTKNERERAIIECTLSDADALEELKTRRANFLTKAELPQQQRDRGLKIFDKAIDYEAPAAIAAQEPVARLLKETILGIARIVLEIKQSTLATSNALGNQGSYTANVDGKAGMEGMTPISTSSKNDELPAASSLQRPAPAPTPAPVRRKSLPHVIAAPVPVRKRSHPKDDAQEMRQSKRHHVESESDHPPKRARSELLIPLPTSWDNEHFPSILPHDQDDIPLDPPKTKSKSRRKDTWEYVPVDPMEVDTSRGFVAPPVDINQKRTLRRSTLKKSKATEAKRKRSLIVKLRVQVSKDRLKEHKPTEEHEQIPEKLTQAACQTPAEAKAAGHDVVVLPPPPGSGNADATDHSVRSSLQQPSIISANLLTDDDRTSWGKASALSSTTLPPLSLPPFPPLEPREIFPFYKGALIAIENIAEDHVEHPTHTLSQLVEQLEQDKPLVNDWERRTVLEGGEYVYEALKAMVGERTIVIEEMCEEFTAHVGREHDFMQEKLRKGGRSYGS